MKRLALILSSLFMVMGMSGCMEVNDDYDLTEINTDNITIGDEFIAPIGKVSTTLADMMAMDLKTESGRQAVDSEVVSYCGTYEYGTIDPEIVEALTASGDLYLILEVENYTPIFLSGYVEFLNENDEVVCAPVERVNIAAGSNDIASTSSIEVEISTEDFIAMASASKIYLEYSTNAIGYEPTDDDIVVITIKTRKTGGITLDI